MVNENDSSAPILFGSRALALFCKKYLNFDYSVSQWQDWDFCGINDQRPSVQVPSHYINLFSPNQPFNNEFQQMVQDFGLFEEIDGWRVCEPRLLFVSWMCRVYKGCSQKVVQDIHKFILVREILKLKNQWESFKGRVQEIVCKYNLCFDMSDFYLNQIAHLGSTDIILVGQCAYKLFCLDKSGDSVNIEDLTFWTTTDNQYTDKRLGGSFVRTFHVDNPEFLICKKVKILHPKKFLFVYEQLLTKEQFTNLKKLLKYV